ncbi:3'-5' exoribonuclease HELZ2-like [Branchiostoma lanceolatum]|uniref:3'-5' exoribonuclease HELZ2-like n=1 Tax=Branchiostoma lanceolatum TaxID=7740 RepID=UPI00345112D1
MEYLWAYDPYTDSFHLEEEESPYVPPWYFYSPRQRRKIELAGKMHCIHSSMQGFGPDLEHACEGCLGKLKKDLKEEAKGCYDEQDFEAAYRYYSNCLEVCQCGNGIYLPTTDWEFVRISYTNRAVCCYRRGDYGLVIQDCEAALRLVEFLKLPPESRQKPLYWKAMALKKLHRYTDAWSTAEQCKRIASDDSYIRALMEKIRPRLASSNVLSLRALLPPDDDPHQAESLEEQAGHAYQVSDDTANLKGSKQADVSVPQEARTEESDTSTKSKTTHQTPVNTPKKSKKQSKAERRRKEMEEIGHQLPEEEKQGLKEEQKKQKASETAVSQSEAAALQDEKEMASNDSKEHEEDTDVSGDEKIKRKEEESGGKGEEIEERKRNGDVISRDGGIVEELQEEFIAANTIFARNPVCGPSPTHSSSSSSSPSFGPSSSASPISGSSANDPDTIAPVGAASTLVSGKYEFLLACDVCFVQEKGLHGVGAFSYNISTNHRCKGNILLARNRNSGESFKKIRPILNRHFMGTYELCRQFQEHCPCKIGESRCTFAHNEIERDLWTREREKAFNRKVVTVQLRAKNPDRWLKAKSSCCSLTNSPDTSTDSSGTAEPVEESSIGDLRRQVYDYKLACDACFVRDGSKHGVGAYTVHNKKHNCGEDFLLARKKNADDAFKKVRPRPQHAFFGTYKLCQQFQSAMPCMLGESRCTFTHSEIEIDLWTRERQGKFNRDELMSQLSKSSPSEADAVKRLRQKHGGVFRFLCKECFQGSPTVISDSSLCDRHLGQRQADIELLVHARDTSKGEIRFTPIMPLPQLTATQIPLFCAYMDKCTFGGGRCGRAHGQVEMDVWMLERKYGTSQRQLVTGSSNTIGSRPMGNVPAQWRHVECPFRLQFVCRQCWLSGGGVVSEVSTNGKTCKRNIHAWNEENKMCLSIGARKEIRKMPEKFIFKFEMCHYAQPGKCCFLGKKCTFAHSEEEMKIWTFQKETKLRDLEVLVSISQQQHGRPSTPTTSSPQASPRTSDFPLLTPRTSQYYCNLCHRTCNGMVTFDQHCSSEGHQARLRSDASDNWQYRRPPWIGQQEEYKLCRSHAVGLCPYDGVEDRHNICPDAHSLEELDEWKERRQHRWLNMEMARKQNLFSYMDKLMEEYEKTTDGPSVIADSLKGVSITCTQDESILLKNKGAKCTWTFTVTSKEPLEHVALLFNQHRTHFSLHGTELERNCQVAEGKQFSNPSDNTYHVEVQGTSQMFGVFHQWVVFDFGKRPVVNRRVVLYVGSVGSDGAVQVKPDPPDFERWHSGNRSIVKFAEGLSPENEALLAKYKEPTEEKGEVLARLSQRKKELDETVYKTRMHDLLYLEELTRNREIASIRKETTLELSDRIDDGILLFAEGGTLYTKLRLQQNQLSEDGPAGKLILTSVTTVLLAPKGNATNKVYEAAIVQLKGFEGRRKEEIYLQLSSRCCQDLDLSSGTTVEFEIRFQLDRLHFCIMHFAVDNMTALHAIFPGRADMSWVTVVESLPTHRVQDAQLNAKQRTAVTRIMSRRGDTNPPVLLYGPFGTGKTRTMASAALQILEQKGTKVLIATHSNSAADLYVKEYIHPYVTSGHPEAKPLRVYFKERRLETVDDTVMQYCKLDPDQNSIAMPKMEDITNHRIVIVTLTTSMYLIRMGIKRGHFTHILLDEAAQAMECETILPLCLADPTTRIVLSGDHKQISPKVHSTEACDLSFDMSLLQRMVQRYIRFGKGLTEKAENPFLVMLTDNYRCCEEILRFLSESFYGGLKSVGQPRHPRWYPLTFFSAEGDDKTGDYSTSYFNIAEVLEIAERVEKLWKDWPEEWGPRNMADIGVITPYHNQTQLIRKELRQKRLGGVTVEMVTNIQGKQFRAVFISTVRTRATCAQNNDRNSYGFLSDSKLLNTAMTRAQSLVAVVGDPHALCSRGECQRVWQRFISQCEKNKSLFPQTLTMSQIYETSESTPLNPKAQPFTPKGPATPWSQGASAPSSTPEKIDEPDEIIRQLILESLEDENEEEARRFKAETFDPNKVAVVQSQRDPSQVYLHYSSGQRASVRRPAQPRLERPRLGANNADREYDSGEDEPYDPTQLEVQEESDNQCFYTNYPPEELENLLQTEPDQYRRCRLVVKGTYTAYAEVIGTDEDDIVINSRKNRGLGWSNDEVVVKILENTDQESAEVFTTTSDTKRGKVVGIIKSAVSLHLRKFVCVVDGNNHNVMVPINTDAPKLMTYFGKENRRHNKVRVYSYMSDGSFRFKKYEDIDPMDPYKKMFVVRFLKWTPRYVYPLGVVTDVITPDSTLDTSMEIINNRFNVPSKYKGKVEEDVNRRYFVDWQIPPKERNQRKDLSRTHTVFTVDPPEAMDLDDAFSVETNLGGTYTVGIHIADVSCFLPTGSDLDKEAKERSTTLYNHTGKPPVHMIPKRLSEGVCSLLPNRDRLALSLFVKFNSDGDVVGEPTMERCVVHSRAKLSYAQAEDIIAGWGSLIVPQEVQDSVRILHTIAAAHRQKRLGPAHLYHQPDEDKDTAVKAHTMVEEMMILANTTVAQVLLQSFPQTTPIRKQQPPKKEKLENWRKGHAGLNGYSVELAKSLPNDVGDNTDALPEDIPLRKDVWDKIRFAALSGDLDTIQQLVCTDENHPTLSRALLQLRGIQDRAMFTCSEDEQRRHHSLNQSAYTYFSSPIRRYIDVVVHRLLVALIAKQPPPYTSDEIKKICSHYNNMENNAKTYERETLVLKLAYDWMTKPEVMYPVIDTVDGQEIHLLMPSVRHTESRQRRVAFSLLKPTALPAPEDEGESVDVRWKQRIYDTAPDKTKLPWPSDRKKPLQLDSERYVIRIPGQYWQRLVQHVQTGNMGFIRDVVTYIEDVVGMQLTLGPRVFEEVSSEAREGLFADHFCTFQMTYTPGQVVKVQLTGDMRKGLLSPCIQLFNLTPKMDVCLDHRRDAVTRFAVPATRSVGNISRYTSVNAYQDRWLPIMAVEAAHCAVENNESVIVHSTFISWKKREQTTGGVAYFGEITLSQKFCKDRSIYFNQDNQSNLAAVNDFKKHFDYICVRYTGVRAAMTHAGHFDIATDKSEKNSPLVCWVGHCLVMPGVQFSKSEDGNIIVPIKLHQHLMAFPDALLHHGTSIPATIEIITKTLPDRRMENAVRWLSGSSDLVQQIATGKPITAQGNPLASEVTIEPLPAFFPLNQVQEQAVKQAIRQPFTLIQGPPALGTGKTVTGVHIAYYLAQMNKLIQSVSGEGMYPPQVLYCGPSNKAVDVVTGYMKRIKSDLKIVRMYSDMIEKEEFPIPNEPVHPNKCKSEKESKLTSEHDDVSLHHLIRKPGNPYAEAIRAFETLFKDPNYTVTEKDVTDYKIRVIKAKVHELRQKHVILCTCTAAASPKMGMATNIEQCIVDECGMCTEPESFVPIVGAPVDRNGSATFHNPKQVILIGDHQQLRPIVLEKTSQQLGLDTSLFQRYAWKATMLTTQYRMHEAICSFPSRMFYENKLRTHQSVTARPRHPTLDRLWPGGANRPTAFCHVVGREEVQTVATAEGNQMSRSNETEADMAVKMAVSLVREHNIQPQNIILLSQYRAQCALIYKKLSAERKKLNDVRLERVGVNSVVASQGSEWDYVIFSTVRSLPSYEIEQNPSPSWLRKYLGFIMDQNQVNVAITRAKRGLCIIGNKNLLRVHSLWNKLVTDYEEHKCLVNNKNFLQLTRAPSQQNAWRSQQFPGGIGTS